VKTRAQVHPELLVFRVGRRFRGLPNKSVIQDFLQHVWNTGLPHTWKSITTTPHPEGEASKILAGFSIPLRMRNGAETRAPCSICSVAHPKFDHGFLVFCSDGHLRIIGQDCGHDFFEGDSFAEELKEHDELNAEEAARKLLSERMPELARNLVEAVTVARDLRDFLDFRERAFASITQRAVATVRRARIGDQLTVDVEMDAVDGKGRRVLQKQVVATVKGLNALVPPPRVLADLLDGIQDAGRFWIVERDEIPERLKVMTRHEVFAVGKAVRRLETALTRARSVCDDLRVLFSEDGLRGLSGWGRHNQCPTPFWIEVVAGRRVYLNKGLRPRFWERGVYLQMPSDAAYQPVEVV